MTPPKHTHVWVHVASRDPRGRHVIVCRCTCGRTLSPSQILSMREAAA